MDVAQFPNILVMASYLVGLLGIGGGVFSFLRYTSYQTTVKLQNDNIKALQDQNNIQKTELAEIKKAHIEDARAIANLEGKLQSYKEIPLQQISESMSKIADSNVKILSILEKMPMMDNGLMVKPKEGQTATVKVIS